MVDKGIASPEGPCKNLQSKKQRTFYVLTSWLSSGYESEKFINVCSGFGSYVTVFLSKCKITLGCRNEKGSEKSF